MPRLIEPLNLFERLEPHITQISSFVYSQEPLFLIILKASLVKSFEFNCFVWKLEPESYPFFSTATLRGICEDLITLLFLRNLDIEDSNILIDLLLHHNIHEGIKIQRDFFSQNRPGQPIIGRNTQNSKLKIEEIKEKIAILARKYQWKANSHTGLPTIKVMAESCDLSTLYNYLFAATSKWVHFSPAILMRMGWGSGKTTDDVFQFSTQHFNEYYLRFNRFYSVYLLVKFFDEFKEELELNNDCLSQVEELKTYISEDIRWPEVITFEEMNKPTPSEIFYILGKIISDKQE